jgi:hypothetical protein
LCRQEINDIASDPDNRNAFYVESRAQIQAAANNILNEICA